jgi:hypothetical protein
MLSGRTAPELGGSPEWLDAAGLNFYSDNQWYLDGSTIPLGRHDYRPLADMLAETHARYGRPLLVTETGGEGSARAAWFHYVCDEVRDAIGRGVPVEGVCLYPVASFPAGTTGITGSSAFRPASRRRHAGDLRAPRRRARPPAGAARGRPRRPRRHAATASRSA